MVGKRRMRWAAWMLLVLSFGCGGSTNNPGLAPDPVVGFINASPNSVALDALLNDTQIGNNVGYLGSSPVSGGVVTFRSLEPGDYDLSIQEDADPQTQAIELGTLNRDKSYLLFAAGLVVPPSTELDKRLRPVLFELDRAKPNGDKARLVILHAYNRAEGFDTPGIDFRNPGDNPTVNETNIPFAGARQILIDAGAQTFVARGTGTEFEVTPQTTFTFEGGKIYAALVSGTEGTGRPPRITFVEIQSK